jgi:hypothetical protein
MNRRIRFYLLLCLAIPLTLMSNGCLDNVFGPVALNADLSVTVLWGDSGDPVANQPIATTKSNYHTYTNSFGKAILVTRSTDNSETITVTVAGHPKSWTVGLQRGGTTVTLYY